MKVCLIFPPVSDPRGPHLALGALASALRHAGFEVMLRDVDLEMALYLLSPDVLLEHLQMAKKKLQSLDIHNTQAGWETLAWRQKLNQSIDVAGPLLKKIPTHLQTLKSKAFYQREHYFAARRAIDIALSLICATYDYRLQYKIDGQVFTTRFKDYLLDDLLKAVDNPQGNLFGLFYTEKIIPEILSYKPNLVGVSILNYQQVIPGLTLAYQLKKYGLKVVIGGTVYSKFVPSLCKSIDFFTFCDAVVVGDGESALVALMQSVQKNPTKHDFSSVPNLLWPDGKKVKANKPFQVEDLCRLPVADFSGLPLDAYLAPGLVLPYNLGKGCYWNQCRFCEIPFINNIAGGSYWRVKPPKMIVDQLEELSERYHTPYFQFTDESCHPDLLEEIADIILARKLKLFYLCYARLDKKFTPALLKKLRKSGLRKLMFGLESGSDYILKEIRKGITAEQAEQVLSNCASAGVHFRLFVIVGFPGETLEHAWETRNFLRRISPLLSDPLNSFEVNLFHLDTNSCYGNEPQKYNISWTGKKYGEFYLGGDRFSCPQSMDKKTLHRFIKTLRQELYRLAEVSLKHSGWEEYSLLHICHCEDTGPTT